MKRVFAIAVVVELVFVIVLLHSAIKEFLWTHPWWLSFLAALPEIALAIFAGFELSHSGEANTLRFEANVLRAEANRLQDRIASLTAELDAERNKHLQQIAKNTEKPVTQAEKNADTLRKHLRAKVTVSEEHGDWGNITPEIVEVNDDNIVTLFTPRGYSSSTAWCIKVHCGDLEITDIPQGSCPLRLKVLKRYGNVVQLGEITKWENRLQPAANPTFAKRVTAYHAMYSKPGLSKSRSLCVYASSDGANSFLLEASTGETAMGNNKEISKRFMVLQIEYEAAGFGRSSSGTGSSPHRLFIS
jgi:hypothetical protein